MKTESFAAVTVGFLEVNCYIVPSQDGCSVFVIDPGGDSDKIIAAARKFKPERYIILLTHGHVDHIGAVKELKGMVDVEELYLHSDDHPLYFSPQNAVLPFIPPVSTPPAG